MAESKRNYWKLAAYLLAAFCLLLILDNSCGHVGSFLSCGGGRDTLEHTIDTAITQKKKDTVYVPKPYKVDSIVYVPVPGKTKTVTNTVEVEKEYTGPVDHPEYIPMDPDTCCKRLSEFGISYYNDSLKIDSHTLARVKDTVRGKILGRGFHLEKIDTTIKEKTKVSQAKKFQVLVGFSLLGNRHEPFYMPGAKLTFKFQNDQQYYIGTKRRLVDGQTFYEVGSDFPLRIFKTGKK